jgi:hypothetical protein
MLDPRSDEQGLSRTDVRADADGHPRVPLEPFV